MLRPSINPQSNAQDDELSEMLRVQFDIQEMNAFFGGFAEEMVPDYFRTRPVSAPKSRRKSISGKITERPNSDSFEPISTTIAPSSTQAFDRFAF